MLHYDGRLLHAHLDTPRLGRITTTEGHRRTAHQHALSRNTGSDQCIPHRQRTIFRNNGIHGRAARFIVITRQQHTRLWRCSNRGDNRGDLVGCSRRQLSLTQIEIDLDQGLTHFDYIHENLFGCDSHDGRGPELRNW